MATIIDSLLVTLGLDNSSYKKGVKESDKEKDRLVKNVKRGDKELSESESKVEKERVRQQKENQKRNKQMTDGLSRLRNETLAFLTLFTAGKGITSFVANSIDLTAALSRMHDNVDMSTADLAGWEYAAKNAGGSAQGMLSAINKANAAVGSMRVGMANSDAIGYFNAGGSDRNAFKSTTDFLLAQADVVKKLYDKDPTTAMFKARQFMGIDVDTFNLMKQGRAAVLAQIETGKKLSGMNEAQGKEAIRAQQQWNGLLTILDNIGRKILFAVSPAVLKLLKDLLGVVASKENMDKLAKSFDDLKKWLDGIDWAKAKTGFQDLLTIGMAMVSTIAQIVSGWTQLHDLFTNQNSNRDLITNLNYMFGGKGENIGNNTGTFADSSLGKWWHGMMNNSSGVQQGTRTSVEANTKIYINTADNPKAIGDAARSGQAQAINDFFPKTLTANAQ